MTGFSTTSFQAGAIALTILLAACAGTELQRTEGLKPQGSAFSKDLFAGYINLSKDEFNEGDYRDSDVFAKRAAAAAGGDNVGPEDIGARKLPAAKVGHLVAARSRLMAALNAGGRNAAPRPAATAQIKFDCWMQEQEENHQPEDIARCRSEFGVAVAQIEAALPRPVAAMPAPTPKAVAKMPPALQAKQYGLEFGFNKSRANLATSKQLDVILAEWKGKPIKVLVSGHTDTVGPEIYNLSLAQRRAEAIRIMFIQKGVPAKSIRAHGVGEANLLIKTGDNVRARKNRRVLISVESAK